MNKTIDFKLIINLDGFKYYYIYIYNNNISLYS